MALTFEKVKDFILDELRAKGYAPNPGDVVGAAQKIMAEIEAAATPVVKELVKEAENKVTEVVLTEADKVLGPKIVSPPA